MCEHLRLATIQSRNVDEHRYATPGNMGTGWHHVVHQCNRFGLRTCAALLFIAALLANTSGALAGTTGGLSGTVTDDSGKPIAAATVTVASPSQTASTQTNAAGRFTFLSLAPDTYEISAQKDGYNPVSFTGISVFADNVQTIAIRTTAALKTIASVTSRAAGSLVKPGTVSDVYSVNAATQQTVRGLGGGGGLNNAYSGIAAAPGVYIPQGQNGWAQSVYVRGSNYTELGYEYDGVPVQRSFDSYPAATLSALGQQELQVYTGAAPADAQSQAVGGFINQVIRTGTYPGQGTGSVDVGTPTFYHKGLVEVGGAAPNRLFNYYLGVAGYNQAYRYGDQFDGTSLDQLYGGGYNFIASGCGGANPTMGCYTNTSGVFGAFPAGPNGYAIGPFYYGPGTSMISDREIVANVHFGIPHHKDSGRDDIQLLYNNSYLMTQFPTSQNDWTYVSNDIINGAATYNGVTYPSCTTAAPAPCALLATSQLSYVDTKVFTGTVGAPLTSSMLSQTAPYYQPNSPTNRAFNIAAPVAERDLYQNDASIFKLQYQKNMGSNAYARIFGYTFYSDWLQNSLSGATLGNALVSAISPSYAIITHTYGVVLQAADQINEQNLLTLSAGYYQANTTRFNNGWYAASPTVAVAVNSANPTNGICYGGAGPTPTPIACNNKNVWQYELSPVVPGTTTVGPLVPKTTSTNASPDINTIGTMTCGTAPCEYFTVGSGNAGAYNTVQPQFTNLALQDNLHLGDRLLLNAGVHYDSFTYALANTGTAPSIIQPGQAARTLYANSFTTWYCFSPITGLTQQTTPNSCPAGSSPTTWSNTGPNANNYNGWQPRLGLTYTVNPLNVIRFSYGKFLGPANSAYQQYQNLSNDLPLASPNNSFYQFGFTNPVHQVGPEISYNTDLSWEHQLKGTDMSWKITPYQRITDNAIYTVLLDPKTNFVSGLNVGREYAAGVELQFQKGDFNRNGVAVLLNYTYTHATVRFGALPNGNTVADNINGLILQYNSYTKFCATNPTASQCTFKGSTVLPTNGTTAAPCYTSTGAADAACAPGSIANPYWNAPPQGLFSSNTDFVPYNQLPGTNAGTSPVASSYVIPHVVSLVVNYKHNKFAVTPLLQFSGGGKYGLPTSSTGIDPASGCSALAGSITGDPRYPYGAPGGAPYNAATCPGSVTAPDFVTHTYDGFGAFTEPNELSTSLNLSYDVTPRIRLNALLSNLYVNCFGGSQEPWLVGPKVGCWYTGTNNGTGSYPGNFFNPGDVIQPALKQPYVPFTGNTFQSGYAGQVNPFNLYVSATVKI